MCEGAPTRSYKDQPKIMNLCRIRINHALALYLRVKESGWSNDKGDNDGEDDDVGGALCRNDGG